MRSFRSKPIGWRYESHRHSLAAKGIHSKKYFADQVQEAALEAHRTNEFREDIADVMNLSAELGRRAAVKNALAKSKKQRLEIDQNNKSNGNKFVRVVRRFSRPTTGVTKGPAVLRGEASILRTTSEEIMARRPVNAAIGEIEKNHFNTQIPIYSDDGRVTGYISIQNIIAGRGIYLSADEREAVRLALVNKAVQYVNSGGKESNLPVFVREQIHKGSFGSDKEKGFFGPKQTESEKELAKIEKARKIAEESPTVSELKAYGRSKVVGAVEGVAEGVAGAPGAIVEGVEDIYGAKQEFHLGEEQQFKGLGQRIDEFDKSALFQTNAAIGNEEDGSFKFMNNEPKIQAKLEGREPSREQFGSMGGFFDNLTGFDTGRPDSYAKKVENEVNSLFQAKHNLADVDLTSFNKGTKAFKEGKREEVVKAVADLESEERKVKDRYTLVQKTWQKMLTENNQDSLFKDSRDSWSVLGADGGKKLAEETEKLNDVKASLTKSASMVADRKYILKNRLGRMDANVPLETGAPQGRQITVVEDSDKKDVVTSLQKPGRVIEEVFEGNN